MDPRKVSTKAASQRGRVLKTRIAGAAAIALTGALSVGAALAPTAGATTKPTTAQTAAKQLAALQKKLTGFENAAPSGVTLSEAGSSLFYPIMQTWAQAYKADTVNSAAGGSGAGQSGALAGTLDIGASDAYLPPTGFAGVLNIPVVVSAQQIDYNLSGLPKGTHLKLNGKILDAMYNGTITMWNDRTIAALNKGVSLPAVKVVPVERSDSSGDTFLFSAYLSAQAPNGFITQLGGPGQGTTAWPKVSGELSAKGNTGMLSTCEATPGCIAYIGVSYLRGAAAAGLGYAALQNGYTGKGGHQFVLPTVQNIDTEVASYKKIPSNGTISLINSTSAKFGYPIANFEYAIVKQSQPSATKAAAIKAFLAWAMDTRHGATTGFLAPVYFRALPQNALTVAVAQLASISS